MHHAPAGNVYRPPTGGGGATALSYRHSHDDQPGMPAHALPQQQHVRFQGEAPQQGPAAGSWAAHPVAGGAYTSPPARKHGSTGGNSSAWGSSGGGSAAEQGQQQTPARTAPVMRSGLYVPPARRFRPKSGSTGGHLEAPAAAAAAAAAASGTQHTVAAEAAGAARAGAEKLEALSLSVRAPKTSPPCAPPPSASQPLSAAVATVASPSAVAHVTGMMAGEAMEPSAAQGVCVCVRALQRRQGVCMHSGYDKGSSAAHQTGCLGMSAQCV